MQRRLPTFLAAASMAAVLWWGSKRTAKQPNLALLESCPQVPASVRPILHRACLDCHSNETRWPWYNRLPAASWLIQHDADKARERLNFSTWTGSTPHLATPNEIQEICDAVSDATMPPWRYRLLHSDAALSEEDKNNFCDWANQVRRTSSGKAVDGQ